MSGIKMHKKFLLLLVVATGFVTESNAMNWLWGRGGVQPQGELQATGGVLPQNVDLEQTNRQINRAELQDRFRNGVLGGLIGTGFGLYLTRNSGESNIFFGMGLFGGFTGAIVADMFFRPSGHSLNRQLIRHLHTQEQLLVRQEQQLAQLQEEARQREAAAAADRQQRAEAAAADRARIEAAAQQREEAATRQRVALARALAGTEQNLTRQIDGVRTDTAAIRNTTDRLAMFLDRLEQQPALPPAQQQQQRALAGSAPQQNLMHPVAAGFGLGYPGVPPFLVRTVQQQQAETPPVEDID